MKKWKLVGLALAVAAGLSACVPVAEGTSMSNPILTESPLDPVKVKAGSTWYVSSLYSTRRFEVSDSDLNRILQKPNYYKGDKIRSGLGGFSLVSANAPEGWKVGLVGANGYREITDVIGDTFHYIQGVELMFGVEIPKDAKGTMVPITARVSYNGKIESAGFLVQLTQ